MIDLPCGNVECLSIAVPLLHADFNENLFVTRTVRELMEQRGYTEITNEVTIEMNNFIMFM